MAAFITSQMDSSIIDLGSGSEDEDEDASTPPSSMQIDILGDTIANCPPKSKDIVSDDLYSKDVRAELEGKLAKISSAGNFACQGDYDSSIPIIRLSRSGRAVGSILTTGDAKALIAEAGGKGNETPVDPSGRNTWELDRSQFEFLNEQWDRTIDQVCD